MTREEATIQSLLGHIEAIEQEPCEDVVSRQTVLELFAKNVDAVRPYSQTWQEVKDLPSVTPTRIETVTEFADRCRGCGRQKKGKWLKEHVGFMYDVCSECGQRVTSGYFEYNYCPTCGAKMRGSEE